MASERPAPAPTTPPNVGEVTALLLAVGDGEQGAFDALLPVVYDELKRVARGRLRHESAANPLQTTALVHEAYIRLIDQRQVQWANRSHFFAVASLAMRRLLVNAARDRQRLKRGGGAVLLPLDEELAAGPAERTVDILALDQALTQLEAVSERARRVVECRFFGGLSIDETAEALGVAPMTVKRDWRTARAWLARSMGAPTG